MSKIKYQNCHQAAQNILMKQRSLMNHQIHMELQILMKACNLLNQQRTMLRTQSQGEPQRRLKKIHYKILLMQGEHQVQGNSYHQLGNGLKIIHLN